MIPTAIRVFPLGRTKEPQAFGTREKAVNFFCHELKSRENPPGRFNIPYDSKFKKGSLILFQYTEREGREEIIAHALLISDGCILSDEVNNYIGYYQFDVNSINFYNTPVTKDEIFKICRRYLYQRSKLLLDVSKYDDYRELLKKNNIRSKCP
jgi:hypothetical protein